MAKKKKFSAKLEKMGNGTFITIPFDVEEFFGKKRVKVKATFDGEPYQGSITRMGGCDHILLVKKEIRQKLGKDEGDSIKVVVEEDTEPRVVVIPDDFKKELAKDKKVKAFF